MRGDPVLVNAGVTQRIIELESTVALTLLPNGAVPNANMQYAVDSKLVPETVIVVPPPCGPRVGTRLMRVAKRKL